MNKFNLKSLPIFIIGLLIAISCADEPLKVGIDILPEEDRLNALVDTQAIKCMTAFYQLPSYSTVPIASGSSSEIFNLDNAPIGHVQDSVFGQTWAQLFCQFEKGRDYYGADTTIEPDDNLDQYVDAYIYFNINDSETFGDNSITNPGFDVFAYKLKEVMNYGSSSGYPQTNYIVKSDEFLFEDNPVSDVSEFFVVDTNMALNEHLDSGRYLRVELDDAFAQLFMDTAIINNEFTSQFPGFLLQSAKKSTTGSLHNFFFNKSKIIVSYTREDSTIYLAHKMSNYQGFYKFDYNGSHFEQTLNTDIETNNFYLQGLDGVKGLIEFSEIEQFREENENKIGINYAELVFPLQDRSDTVDFAIPGRITARHALEDGSSQQLIDDGLGGFGYFGGKYDEETNEYRINVTETLHLYMDRNDNVTNKIYLAPALDNNAESAAFDYKTPNRLVLNSGSHPTKPAYLRIIYTLTSNN